MNIEEGGASSIDIIEYSKAARVKVLHEAIIMESQLALTFFDSALKLIDIEKNQFLKWLPGK